MEIRSGSWQQMRALVSPLRREVFIVEQQVPEELEWDDDDATALHFAAYTAPARPDDQGVIGCARLLPSGQIGRMAVLPHYRRQGIGAALLRATEEAATRQGITQVFLHAQTHAVPFYRQFAYRVTSEEFLDAGIPHVTMVKRIPSTV